MSTIDTTNIDDDYPVAGQDNDSQGFRNNFTNITTALDQAKTEITSLEEVQGKIAIFPSTAPQPKGSATDKAGMIIHESGFIYFCFKDYTLGTEQIWARSPVIPPVDLTNWV